MPQSLQVTLATGDSTGIYDSPEYLAATDSFYTRFFVRSGWPRPAPATCEGRGDFNTQIYQYMWGPTEFTATGTLRDFDRTDRLSALDLPVLFIVGRYDEARPETMAAFQQRVPGSRLEIIDNAGHMSMEDQPERFNSAVAAFLSSIEGKR
jgi:proline iminopeptidase